MQPFLEKFNAEVSALVNITSKTTYVNWKAFFDDFSRRGGIIEAASCKMRGNSPMVVFLVSPTGSVNVLCTMDQASIQICVLDWDSKDSIRYSMKCTGSAAEQYLKSHCHMQS